MDEALRGHAYLITEYEGGGAAERMPLDWLSSVHDLDAHDLASCKERHSEQLENFKYNLPHSEPAAMHTFNPFEMLTTCREAREVSDRDIVTSAVAAVAGELP